MSGQLRDGPGSHGQRGFLRRGFDAKGGRNRREMQIKMNVDYPVQEMPATPEYILAVIKDVYRQQCQYDPETEKNALLTFDSTIQEWRDACDLLGWQKLARALNDWFK